MNETFVLAITVLPFWLAVAVLVLGLLPLIVTTARASKVKPTVVQSVSAGLGFLVSSYASLNAVSPLLIG